MSIKESDAKTVSLFFFITYCLMDQYNRYFSFVASIMVQKNTNYH